MTLKELIGQSIEENYVAEIEHNVFSAIKEREARKSNHQQPGKIHQFTTGGRRMKTAKTWSRKLLAACVAAALVVTAVVVSFALSATTLALVLDKEGGYAPGEDVVLSVKATEDGSIASGVVGLTMTVEYDTSKLTYKGIVEDEFVPSVGIAGVGVTADTQKFEVLDNVNVEDDLKEIFILVYALGENSADNDIFYKAGAELFQLEFKLNNSVSPGTTITNAFKVTETNLAGSATKGIFTLFPAPTLPTKNLIVKAAAYTATVHYADDSIVSLPVLNNVADFTEITADEKEGAAFIGWFYDGDTPVPVTESNQTFALTKSIDIYAKFVQLEGLSALEVQPNTADPYKDDPIVKNKAFGILGAARRTETSTLNKTDLRFMARISDEVIESLGATNVKYGMILVTEYYFNHELGGGFLGNNTWKALLEDDGKLPVNKSVGYAKTAKIEAENKYNVFGEGEGEYKLFTTVATGIPSSNNNTKIVVRAYIEYKDAQGVDRVYYATESGTGDNYTTANGAYWKSVTNVLADEEANP